MVTLEVTVTRLRPSLIRVCRPTGEYQLVLCGRLLLEVAGDSRIAHPDLPAYTPEMFPEDFVAWSDSGGSTKVTMMTRKGKERDTGPVRASSLLFNALPVETAKAWLKERAGR